MAKKNIFSDVRLKETKSLKQKENITGYYEKNVPVDPKDVKVLKEYKPKDKKKIIGFSLITLGIVAVAVILPMTLLREVQPNMIRTSQNMQHANGFTPLETEFTIKHVDSGKYLSDPTSTDNQQLQLTDDVTVVWDSTNNAVFTFGENIYQNELTIDSRDTYAGEQLSISTLNDIPVWGTSSTLEINTGGTEYDGTYKQEVIELQQNGDKDEYAIYLTSVDRYVGDPDADGNLYLTKTPDWFVFETQNQIFQEASEWAKFMEKISGVPHTYGSQGQTMAIKHDETDMFITNYDHEIGLGHDPHYNWFFGSNDAGTLTLNTYDDVDYGEYGKHWHMDMRVNNGEFTFETATDGYDQPHTIDPTIPELDARWDLVQNPTNLNEYALRHEASFVTGQDSYLGIEDGEVAMVDEAEWFRFYLTPYANADSLFASWWGLESPTSASFIAEFENWMAVDSVEVRAHTAPDVAGKTKNTGWHKFEVKDKATIMTLDGLEEHTYYTTVEMKVHRKEGAGDYTTHLYLPPFHTTWGVYWNWPTTLREGPSTYGDEYPPDNEYPETPDGSEPPSHWFPQNPSYPPITPPDGTDPIDPPTHPPITPPDGTDPIDPPEAPTPPPTEPDVDPIPVEIWDASHEEDPDNLGNPIVSVAEAGEEQAFRVRFIQGSGRTRVERIRVELVDTVTGEKYHTNEVDVSMIDSEDHSNTVFPDGILLEMNPDDDLDPEREYEATLQWIAPRFEDEWWNWPEWESFIDPTYDPLTDFNRGVSQITTITERDFVKLDEVNSGWAYHEDGPQAETIVGGVWYETARPTDEIRFTFADITNGTDVVLDQDIYNPQTYQPWSTAKLYTYPDLIQDRWYELEIRVHARPNPADYNDETDHDNDWAPWTTQWVRIWSTREDAGYQPGLPYILV